MNAKSVMTTIPDKFDLNQLFFEHHEGSFDEKNYEFKAVCRTGIDQKAEEFEYEKITLFGLMGWCKATHSAFY